MPVHTEQLLKKPSNPPIMAGARPRRKKAAGRAKLLILVELALLVAFLGGDIPSAVPHITHPVAQTVAKTGPFISLPLNADEVGKLHHLSSYLSTKTLVNMYLSHMTLDQKLGQLFMVQYWGYSYSADLETMLHDQYAGGVIMYGAQMNTFKQTKSDIARMQEHAGLPLLISTDEEGGFVQRIMNIYGNRPGALQTYQTGNMQNAVKLGQSITHDLQALGINTDLAPDVDVPVVMGPDQYMRTWGYTPQSVIQWGGTFLRTVQGDGEIACLKHFPGLGAATTDAHTGLPVVKRTLDQIYATELAPYQYFVQSKNPLDHPGMIMTTDVLMPAIDPTMPAELSYPAVTGILRNQLGYNGVVITDALYMLGIAKKWSLPQAVVLAIEAGNDMILGVRDSSDLAASVAALKQAIANGDLSMARIDQSVARIIALKIQYHLLQGAPEH
ncbi:MAG TPA: glycoside hydrolase family 3 N-terminal domain-containing protein [Ktedonobacteraceae bacterium]|nr:glycoside hydrolase family 3 N-terminal domain-containing protein [Ktedonobacteraceae bacterium]